MRGLGRTGGGGGSTGGCTSKGGGGTPLGAASSRSSLSLVQPVLSPLRRPIDGSRGQKFNTFYCEISNLLRCAEIFSLCARFRWEIKYLNERLICQGKWLEMSVLFRMGYCAPI